MKNFCGARSKKFEQNLQKNNARAGEIPPLPPFLPAREKANFSDWTISSFSPRF
jgi:hypothetical protein